MPSIRLIALCLLALSGLLAGCTSEAEPFARATEIRSLDQAIGGPKALARPGDLLLENDRVRVAILAATRDGAQRNSLGPGLFGGSIVDADLQWHDPRFSRGQGNDQFAELFPTASMNVPLPVAADDVRILADGSEGGAAIVRAQGVGEPFLELLNALWGIVGQPEMYLVTDYIAEPGKPWIRMETTVYFGWSGEGDPPDSEPMGQPEGDNLPVITLAVDDGVVLGDFYLSGGSIDVFSPGMGFFEDGQVFEAREQGQNLFVEPFRLDFVAGEGDGISYGIAPASGDAWIPLFTAGQTAVIGAGRQGSASGSRFPPGTALSYERYLFVGDGDIGSIVDGWVEAKEVPWGTVTGHVVEESTHLPLSDARVLVFEPGAERPWSAWRTDSDPRDDVADGSFGGRLPVGEWELLAHVEGRPDPERVPITVSRGDAQSVSLVSPRPGVFSFTVEDDWGRRVPAKISIFPVDGEPVRNPDFGDAFIAGGPQEVVWPLYGSGQIELPPGRYQAMASRGLEYELDITEPFEVGASRRHHVDFVVLRSIDTSGWVSADLHVHAQPSHDSGVSRADRVRTMAAEGVEFFVSTDHDHLTDYAPTIQTLGVEEWVRSAVGNETTTVELGHFLGFPMAESFLGEAGGAFDWTGMTPQEILDELRAAGRDAGYEPFVYVGHPRAGILGYFDQYGLDPYDGTPGIAGQPGEPAFDPSPLAAANDLINSSLFTTDFDGIEVMGTKDLYFFRTPTQPELDDFAADGSTTMHDILTRTLAEQQDLKDGVYRMGNGHEGQIDDWFTLLNLGYRHTALANSDTHSWTSTEAGCPRNYVMSSTDQPAFIDEQEIADAVREHRVVATYGPFVRILVDGHPIGSEVVPDDATVDLHVSVQAPSWVDVDRVELYRNGTLFEVIEVPDTLDPYRLDQTVQVPLEQDAWFVAIASGDGDLSPVFTPVEIPYLPLDEVVIEALGAVEGVPSGFLSPAPAIPRQYPVHPFGLTNPIWVDLDGDGFDAPGLPEWLLPPE